MKVKKIYTLGICNGETSSACLFTNGALTSAVSEERFSRIKFDKSFPIRSINFVLKNSNIKLNDIKYICYSWASGWNSNLDYIYKKRLKDLSKNKHELKIFQERKKKECSQDYAGNNEFKIWCRKNLNNKQKKNVRIYNHHNAHAASASYLSPFKKGLVLTSDGRGDYESLTLSIFENNKLKKIYSSTTSDSLGYFYGRITGLLGYERKYEGKVTGLAAHGDPKKAKSLMNKMITVKNGQLLANLGEFYKPYIKPYSKNLIKIINTFKKEDIAAAAQEHLTWCIIEIIKFYSKKMQIRKINLMLAGGTFANVKLNEALKHLPFIKNVFVQPHMSDGGLCLGACCLLLNEKKYKIHKLKDMKLGPVVNNNDFLKKYKNSNKYLIKRAQNISSNICNDLIKNKVIGLVRGKMEFGPRALCNRSIIYKTSDFTVNKWLNKRLKRTETMPFAPVIREELCTKAFKQYSKQDTTLYFMTSTINCTKKFIDKSPAAVHIDSSARPQIVSKQRDLMMWSLLKKWEQKSGEMALLNTSFNVHKEPIVYNYEDALKSLVNGVIDVLYLNIFRITIRDLK